MILKRIKITKKSILKAVSISLLILPLSCHWREFRLSENLIKEFKESKFKDDRYFHYTDYKKFSRELKDLYDLSISFMDKKQVESEREDLIENYIKPWNSTYYFFFIDKDIYENKDMSSDFSEEDIKNFYSIVKSRLENLERENNNNNITKETINVDFRSFYNSIYWVFKFINQYGSKKLKEVYSDFDILFVKEALAKGNKILIYHFPSLYNDLAYLFNISDEYFKED